jgi:hypothetical protein
MKPGLEAPTVISATPGVLLVMPSIHMAAVFSLLVGSMVQKPTGLVD